MRTSREIILAFIFSLFVGTALSIVIFWGHSDLIHGYVTSGALPNNNRILPNPQLTPGVVNQNISQSNIDQNICNKNWSTKSIRPPSSYTTALKIRQIQQYAFTDTNTADYEEDHLISLELGGSPTDPKNLWTESYKTTPNAKDKDTVENYLHTQVCNGSITLTQAQTEISTNWVAVYDQLKTKKGTFGGINMSDNDDE